MAKRALLVVDMTNDFLLKSYNPSLALERGLLLVPRIRRLEESFLKAGLPVIYATDRHLKGDYELKKWGMHSMKGSKGSDIVDGLIKSGLVTLERGWKPSDLRAVKKGQTLFEVEKGSYSGFTDNGGSPTAMDSLLSRLGFRPGDELYITGLHTNCCDKHTAADAWFRGYVPVMVRDCTDAFDNPDGSLGMDHEAAINYEEYWYGARVELSEELADRIARSGR